MRKRPKRADGASLRKYDSTTADYIRSLQDPRETSLAEFIEFFTIKTDVKADEDGDLEPDYVPFVLRPRQAEILDKTAERWALGKSARFRNLKSRRYGMTTFFRAVFLGLAIRRPGWEGMLIAQDDSTTEYLFSLTRDELLPQIPEELRRFEVVKNDNHELFFKDRDSGKISRLRVATAKTNALGRARFNNGIHLTESPHYPPRVKEDLSGLLATCKNVAGNIVVDESTAKGYERFHRNYVNAVKGKGEYIPHFIGAHEHPAARERFDSDEEREEFRATVGKVEDAGPEDELAARRFFPAGKSGDLPYLEFLKWRRFILYDECEGSVKVLKREYPTTWQEAFQGTGRPVFNLALVNAHVEAATNRMRRTGTLMQSLDGVTFNADPNGAWTIYEEPEIGSYYCWGADVAAGFEVSADGKTESDYSTLHMLEVFSGRTVAVFRDHVMPTDFAWEILRGAAYYGAAMGHVERNQDGGTVISHLEEYELGEISGADIMLVTTRVVKSDGQAKQRAEFGWKTLKNTKAKAIDELRTYLAKEVGMPRDGQSPFDKPTLLEMMRYVRAPQATGKIMRKTDGHVSMGADEGHDDLVMSRSIALMARIAVREDLPSASKVERRLPDWLLAIGRDVRAQAREGAVDPVLGAGF